MIKCLRFCVVMLLLALWQPHVFSQNKSKAVLDYLWNTYGNSIYVSIMNQYTPMEQIKNHPLLSRKVTKREYAKVVDYALNLGWENAFIQEGETAKESFIPGFYGEGV